MTHSHLFNIIMKQYEQFYEFKVEDMNSSQVIEDTVTVLQESDELNKS